MRKKQDTDKRTKRDVPAKSTDDAIDDFLLLALGIGAVVVFGGAAVVFGWKALVVTAPF